jgi:hypothetical protein
LRWEGGQTCPYASSLGVGRRRDASLRVIIPTSPARACVSRPHSEGLFRCRGVAFFGCPHQKKNRLKHTADEQTVTQLPGQNKS